MTGTRHRGDLRPANGVAGHFDAQNVNVAHFDIADFRPEPFSIYAAPQLSVCAPWERGVCFNPGCGRAFAPVRDWQVYCCVACESASVAEMRRWGHRMALPLLVWRLGKHEAKDAGLRDLARAARRYVGHAQSAWVAERAARKAETGRGS